MNVVIVGIKSHGFAKAPLGFFIPFEVKESSPKEQLDLVVVWVYL